MSSAFRACRFLFAPPKSAVASSAAKPKPTPKPKGEAQANRWPDGLQKAVSNPANKREIGKLKSLFDGRDKVNFLEISKLLNAHFVKTN